jgi:hypothetical protein
MINLKGRTERERGVEHRLFWIYCKCMITQIFCTLNKGFIWTERGQSNGKRKLVILRFRYIKNNIERKREQGHDSFESVRGRWLRFCPHLCSKHQCDLPLFEWNRIGLVGHLVHVDVREPRAVLEDDRWVFQEDRVVEPVGRERTHSVMVVFIH